MLHSWTSGWRLALRAGSFAVSLAVVSLGSLGCATSPPPPDDRFSPAQLKNGPSLYETGRLGAVQLSNGGLTVDGGSIDPHPHRVPVTGAGRVSSALEPRAGHRAPHKRKPQPHVVP
jgi:hypothetical protein